MKMNRIWSMPNKWTFTIKPIKELLAREVTEGLWIDPFCGENSPANVRNDLDSDNTYAQTHLDALEFLRRQPDNKYDGALYDPPYSLRQASECYKKVGMDKFTKDVTRADYWGNCKTEIARIVKQGGKVICCGWQSMGIGKTRGFKIVEVLLVPHGGKKNDTIVTVEIKIMDAKEK